MRDLRRHAGLAVPAGVTARGPTTGPFTWLAKFIGFDALTGNWLIAAGVASTVLAVVGFLMVLREAYRGTISLRTVTVLAVAYHVAVFLLPLLFSRDVYSYAFYGRIVGIYHQNPYVHTPVEFAGDSLWPLVGPKWVDTPAVYGPLFTSLSGGIARVTTSPSSQVTAYRLLTVLASLATLAMILVTAERVRPGRVTFAAAAYGLNPVVLFLAVGSGHNDVLVALSIIGAVALLTSRAGDVGGGRARPRRTHEGHGGAAVGAGDRLVRGATPQG